MANEGDGKKAGATAGGADRPRSFLLDAEVRDLVAEGKNDDEIAAELDTTPAEIRNARRAVYETEILNTLRRPAEEVYVDYRLKQLRICSALDGVAVEARSASQFTAAASALKAKAGIHDRIILTGQDMGILPRAGVKSSVHVTGGVAIAVATMTDRELSEGTEDEVARRRRLRREYGGSDKKFGDLPAPDIFSEQPAIKPAANVVIDVEPTAKTSPTPTRKKV